MTDLAFPAMGTEVRLVAPGTLGAERAWLEDAAGRLSRFRPDSELCTLNADPRPSVPSSALLRAAIGAAVWAAEATGGLVDPTLVDELEHGGYARSRAGVAPAPLAAALAAAPARAPARPRPGARWRGIRVGAAAVERPPGLRLDTGGTGKGLLADAAAQRLARRGWAVADCGGDIRVAGTSFPVEVRHPLTGRPVARVQLRDGGIATSGIDRRIWRRADGTPAHHLLDPATGEPAWTGLVGVTALAPTALEAETLAKHALLRGPGGAGDVLAAHGGFWFTEDGDSGRA